MYRVNGTHAEYSNEPVNLEGSARSSARWKSEFYKCVLYLHLSLPFGTLLRKGSELFDMFDINVLLDS